MERSDYLFSWLWSLTNCFSVARFDADALSRPGRLGGLLAAGLLVDATYNVVQFSYRLSLIPDELQGRVNSSFRLISYSLKPLGQVLTGVLLQDIGPIFTILAFSLCLVVLAMAASLNPHVRKAR